MSQDDVDTPATDPVEPAPVEPESAEPKVAEPDPATPDADVPATDVSEAVIPDAGIAAPIECPPPADQPERAAEPDPRARLNQLAAQLVQNRSRRLLIEFLQLRRALRV